MKTGAVVTQPQITHGDIQAAWEYFMFNLYGSISAQSLNKQTYNVQPEPWLSIPDLFIYDRNSASSSAAGKFHLYQTYHSVQQRLGNDLSPADWGWRTKGDTLVPIETDQPVAPSKVLRMMSCGCKTGCGRSCGCCKSGLFYLVTSSNCYRIACSDIYVDTGLPGNQAIGF